MMPNQHDSAENPAVEECDGRPISYGENLRRKEALKRWFKGVQDEKREAPR